MILIDEGSDLHREFIPQIIAYVRQYVKDERLVGKIVEHTFLAFENKSDKVHVTERSSLSIYLRITAKGLIKNYVNKSLKHEQVNSH